jgi:cytochrome c oxidase cbb3-type subunit I/II
MWNTPLHSRKLANLHFWLGTLGIVVYASSMYWAGITQSLMWKQFTPFGVLQYPNFLETVTQIVPFYVIRAIGGTLYLTGAIIMVYNLIVTVRRGKLVGEEEVQVPAGWDEKPHAQENRHRWLEKRPVQFAIVSTIAIMIGGLVELIPTFLISSNVPTIASVKPYTPLELEGRDIYVREGCYTCHSQMVRPFRSETERYGEYSKAGEFVYDHPFQWGSKRTGPDLHRVGRKYNNLWHFMHMEDPESVSPSSIMPAYPWLYTQDIDTAHTASKIRAMQSLGVPYPKEYDRQAVSDLKAQAEGIAVNLQKESAPADPSKEIIALIAYLQRLGTDIAVPKQ